MGLKAGDIPKAEARRIEGAKNSWERASNAVGLEKRWPRFHDLRHTWRTNARRSGIDPQIAESIMGHWFKGKSVNDRYGYISDEELVAAIERMTFDHGDTVIFVSKASERASEKNGNSIVTERVPQKKRSRALVT